MALHSYLREDCALVCIGDRSISQHCLGRTFVPPPPHSHKFLHNQSSILPTPLSLPLPSLLPSSLSLPQIKVIEYLVSESERLAARINSVSTAEEDEQLVLGAGDKLSPRVAMARLRLQVSTFFVILSEDLFT